MSHSLHSLASVFSACCQPMRQLQVRGVILRSACCVRMPHNRINGGIVSIDDLLHPPPAYSGNCSASAGDYLHGIDLHNTVNQTYFKMGESGGSVEACCAACASRTSPSPCSFFTYAADTTECYLKASGAGRRKAGANLISGSCVRQSVDNRSTAGAQNGLFLSLTPSFSLCLPINLLCSNHDFPHKTDLGQRQES